MSTHKTYLIQLFPLDTFFFGGETTFGEGNANYYAKSNLFPQQSTLLGALRQMVLFQNRGKLGLGDAELIGAESFDPGGTITDYGLIQGISALLLTEGLGQDSKFWLPDERSHSLAKEEKAVQKHLQPMHLTKGSLGSLKMEGFDPKEGNPAYLLSLDGTQRRQWMHEEKPGTLGVAAGPFKKTFQVGIGKRKLQSTDDEAAFFKKDCYTLAPDHAFAFFARLDAKAHLQGETLCIGGERSPFALKVTEWKGVDPLAQPDAFYANLYPGNETDLIRIVCISDCFLPPEIYAKALYYSTEVSNFRNIRSKIKETKHFAGMGKKGQDLQPHKSARTLLISKGSSFWFNPETHPDPASFFQQPGLQMAGFNTYKIIYPKQQ